MNKGKNCFALSRDPKALVGKRGIFQSIPESVKALCDMNFLGKEIGCVKLSAMTDDNGKYINGFWLEFNGKPSNYTSSILE